MKLYVRSRRLLAAGALMAVIAVISAVIGTNMLTLVSRGDPVAVPYLLVLDAFIAVLAVGSLGSPVPAMDRGDVGVVARARWLHLAGMGALGLLLVVAASLPRSGMGALEAGRAYLAWLGLALLAAGALRESLAAIGPLAGFFVIAWFGHPAGAPASWNWGQAPATVLTSWLVAAGLLAAGLLACARRWRGDLGLPRP